MATTKNKSVPSKLSVFGVGFEAKRGTHTCLLFPRQITFCLSVVFMTDSYAGSCSIEPCFFSGTGVAYPNYGGSRAQSWCWCRVYRQYIPSGKLSVYPAQVANICTTECTVCRASCLIVGCALVAGYAPVPRSTSCPKSVWCCTVLSCSVLCCSGVLFAALCCVVLYYTVMLCSV